MSMQESKLCYNDEYVHFSFATLPSSAFNVCIQNSEDELKMFVNCGDSVNFVSPSNQNKAYALGIKHPQRTLQFKLLAYNVSREDLRHIMSWLKVGNSGVLSFDFAPDWGYDVVVSGLDNPTLIPVDNDEFVATFGITFATVNSTAAKLVVPGTCDCTYTASVTSNNNMYIPPVINYPIGDNEAFRCWIPYLGDDILTVDFVINAVVDNDGNDDKYVDEYNCEIELNENESDKQTVSITQTDVPHDIYVSYSSKTHAFFINDLLPLQAKQQGIVDNISIEKRFEPYVFTSPGAPVKVKDEQHFEALLQSIKNDRYTYAAANVLMFVP